MSLRSICIHGHFYQPPRENAWLEAVETQDSASPYHDWNERITAECYAPNASSRILDARDRISKIVNNYSSISFNFGPTLLSWLEEGAPDTYAAIIHAGRISRERYGHGSAIAQAYNHMIMPLASPRDRRTQVRWGLRDFEHRFGHRPEGMWLPETAVDYDTLEALADEGIEFTILEPGQATTPVDPTMPYRCPLPSGKSIVIFFYNGPISRAVAFENLLARGENLAHRLLETVDLPGPVYFRIGKGGNPGVAGLSGRFKLGDLERVRVGQIESQCRHLRPRAEPGRQRLHGAARVSGLAADGARRSTCQVLNRARRFHGRAAKTAAWP